MTTVRVRVHRPSATGNIPAGGSIQFTPTRATTVGGVPTTLVLPAPFTLSITAEEHLLDLAPNGAGWAWRVYEVFPGITSTTRYLSVPEVFEGTIVDYTALAQVDPATLEPLQDPSAPLWVVYVDALEAEAAAAKVAALAAQSAATGSQTSAAASASAAGASETAAAGSATAASASQTAAAGSATAAQTARTGAETARTGAEAAQGAAAASQTAASASQTAAAGSATAAAASKTGADAARDTAIAHATGFSAGIVTSLSHTAAPTAAVTGEAPALKLDLGIPRGVPTAITIGEVETGPETPGIVGPQGPQGPIGPAGGWTTATGLGATHLDTFFTPGMYSQTNGGNVTTANGYPLTWSTPVVMDIRATHADNSRVEQELTYITGTVNSASRGFWRRTYYTATPGWSPWRHYGSQRVDQTAGRTIYAWDELNGREQIIWGDTGWRDIKGLTINGWTSTSLLIRRVGSSVSLVGNITATAATSDHYLPIQAGFAPFAGNYHGVASSTAVPPLFRPLGTDAVNHYVTSGGFSGTYNLQANYMTVSPWPTTLPGSASGSIPNL